MDAREFENGMLRRQHQFGRRRKRQEIDERLAALFDAHGVQLGLVFGGLGLTHVGARV